MDSICVIRHRCSYGAAAFTVALSPSRRDAALVLSLHLASKPRRLSRTFLQKCRIMARQFYTSDIAVDIHAVLGEPYSSLV